MVTQIFIVTANLKYELTDKAVFTNGKAGDFQIAVEDGKLQIKTTAGHQGQILANFDSIQSI